MKNRRAVGLLNPMRDKNGRQEPGGEGTTPVTTACPEAGKYKCERKKNIRWRGKRTHRASPLQETPLVC